MGTIYNDTILFSNIHELGVYLGYDFEEFERIVIYEECLV